MFHFESPWFALLLPVPYLVWRFFPKKREQVLELRFPSLQRLKKAFPEQEFKPSSDALFTGLLFLCWACLVIALMQPEKIDQYSRVNNQGYDLMLAVDISASMQALDFSTASKKVSRLDLTKEVVGNFVRGRQGDRVGLVTFGEHAYLQAPLTLDTQAVARLLNDTVSGMAGNGTAIGDAIGLSVRTLRDRPEGSRVIVLLTDGDDNSSSLPPMEAARLAKQYGIKIYAIGVGKKGPVPFPTQYGGMAMGQFAMDEELLEQISTLTGGQFFLATDPKSLQMIYQKINSLEKTEVEQAQLLLREPLYMIPLGGCLFLLLLLALLELKRRAAYGH
ncbi:MAG: VWA domain-containing protein [Parachlamydia sp.]|jgi:Ca-activated chloride channel family protein|nr:VWA domain-containing protein [Parachlamydia sp.]